MLKPLALSIAACLGLASCQVFEKSETWDQAVKVRPGQTTRDPDPSNAYAAKLHAVLAERGIEHQVVVYQYHYTTRRREEAVGTRTAVVYRDGSNARYPWWLKDDRSIKPVWLPNGTLDQQISFYLRRKAEVIDRKEYPARGGGSGKSTVALVRPAPAPAPRIAARPAPVTRIAATKKAPAPVAVRPPAPAPKVVKTEEVRTPVVKVPESRPPAAIRETKSAVTKIKPVPRPAPPVAFFTPQPEAAPVEPIASARSGTWAPPVFLDASEQPDITAPRNSDLEKRFRRKHGTDYNRFSPADRRKMQQLQNGVAAAD